MLLEQFKNSPLLKALLGAFLRQVQEVEDALYALNDGRAITEAAGKNLDSIADIVGQSREQLSDKDLRLWVKGRIALNQGKASPEDIFRMLGAILGDDKCLDISEYAETAFAITVKKALDLDASKLFSLLKLAKPVGVRALFQYATKDPVFMFDSPFNSNGYFCEILPV